MSNTRDFEWKIEWRRQRSNLGLPKLIPLNYQFSQKLKLLEDGGFNN